MKHEFGESDLCGTGIHPAVGSDLMTPLFAGLLPNGRGNRQRRRDTFVGLDEKARACSESHRRGRAMTSNQIQIYSTDKQRLSGVPSSLPRRVYHSPDNFLIFKIAFFCRSHPVAHVAGTIVGYVGSALGAGPAG